MPTVPLIWPFNVRVALLLTSMVTSAVATVKLSLIVLAPGVLVAMMEFVSVNAFPYSAKPPLEPLNRI